MKAHAMRIVHAGAVLAILVECGVLAQQRVDATPPNCASITFADEAARERFASYVSFLEEDSEKFASELATVRQLACSDVEYRLRTGSSFPPGAEGLLTTDGERVVIDVSEGTDMDGRSASVNSCIAHEFEHARQIDAGEFAFWRDPETGRWLPLESSCDLGDEVKAWTVQLRASSPADLWTHSNGTIRPTRLLAFKNARTNEERVRILAKVPRYRNIRRSADCNVVFSSTTGYTAGQFLRPTEKANFFGRARTVSIALEESQ
jgi:hypothetical protein